MPSPKTAAELKETSVVGPDTREWIVRSHDCAALGLHHIAHVGVADAAAPYRMVRTNLRGTYLLACFGGEGRILLDGRWQVCRAGMACLAPTHVPHAFHAVPGKRWNFAWVRYEQPPDQKPVINSASPVMTRFDGQALASAVTGLWHEVGAGSDPAALHHWVELVHGYVQRFAQPWTVEDRLWKLWDKVAAKLEDGWTLDRLAKEAHCSSEHLRRLCRRSMGRSPMQQITYLRMQRAAGMLTSTNDKIESIAHAVGYQNPFVFSTTFKKWIGWRPSEYRIHSGVRLKG